MISFDNFRQVSKNLDKFIPAKKTFLQSFQYFSKLPPHGRTIAMGGTQPQVNDVNLAKAEWQQKQLQTWKKNKQHTYWTAYYVGLAIKKLMLLLE